MPQVHPMRRLGAPTPAPRDRSARRLDGQTSVLVNDPPQDEQFVEIMLEDGVGYATARFPSELSTRACLMPDNPSRVCHAQAVTTRLDLEPWLRTTCSVYSFDLRGIFQPRGTHEWPVTLNNEHELDAFIATGGHLLPLPKESAALANVLEVGIVDYILDAASQLDGLQARRGTERGYPDIEFTGDALDGEFHAVDIKVARRKRIKSGVSKNTQSRVTLYTGNTYFRYPKLHWPGTFRPFAEYASHLDVIGIYTLNTESAARVEDLELIVQPPWKIGSRERSSTTREYIGAVVDIDDLREGNGQFATEEEFYTYWRKYPFKIGRAVQQQLDKLLADE